MEEDNCKGNSSANEQNVEFTCNFRKGRIVDIVSYQLLRVLISEVAADGKGKSSYSQRVFAIDNNLLTESDSQSQTGQTLKHILTCKYIVRYYRIVKTPFKDKCE